MKKKYIINQREEIAEIENYGGQKAVVQFSGKHFEMELLSFKDNIVRVNFNGKFLEMACIRVDSKLYLRLPNGRDYVLERHEHKRQKKAVDVVGNSKIIFSPMPGKVLKILHKIGDHVEKGTNVLVLEAMKMEHTLKAQSAGVIGTLKCSEGDVVKAAQELIVLIPDGEQ